MSQKLIQTPDADILIGIPEGACRDCIRWYKNAPDYGLGVTEWICDKSHKPDDNCEYFEEVKK